MKIKGLSIKKPRIAASDFGMRTIDFGKYNGLSFLVSPYQPIAPGLSLGFEESATVRACSRRAENGHKSLFVHVNPGDSRWMTIELDLSRKGVERSQQATALLTIAASPRLQASVGLRIPTKGEDGFVDTHTQRLNLDAKMSNHILSFDMPKVKVFPNRIHACPKIVVFMPLKEATYCLQRLTFSPAKH